MSPGIGIGIGIGAFRTNPAPAFWRALLGYSPLLMLVAGEQCFTDAAKTIAAGDTDAVHTWGNLGTGAYDAVQSNAAKRPLLSVADGVTFMSDSMYMAGMTGGNDVTVVAVINPTSGGTTSVFSPSTTAATAQVYNSTASGNVGINDGGGTREGMAFKSGAQVVTWRSDSSTSKHDFYRDGAHLAQATYDNTYHWGGTGSRLCVRADDLAYYFPGSVRFFAVFNTALSDADLAAVHAILMAQYGLAFTAQSIADIGLAWDADDATLTGSDIATLTDASGNSHTINLVGTVGAVTIGSHQYCRFNGTNNGLQVDDHATLDGATGCTHVLRIANAASVLGSAVTVAQKGLAGTHINGGIGDTALGAGTRFAALMDSADELDVGPVPSAVADTEEALAMAVEGGAAIRRVDPDDTYATNATAATIAVGAGSLTYGMQETGAGTYDEWADVDVSAGMYFARDLNQWELLAAKGLLEP